MRAFLEFLRDATDLQCDFLAFRRKGVWTNEEAEPRVERLVDAARFTADAASRILGPYHCWGDVAPRWAPDRDLGFWSYEVLRSASGVPARRVSPMPLRSAMWVVDPAPPSQRRYEVRAISASGVRGAAAASPPVRA